MNKINIISYIGLALFTAYSIYYYFAPGDADMEVFFLCFFSIGIIPIFLFVSCGIIIYSIVEAFRKRKRPYIITSIWTLALILFWTLTPNLPPIHLDAYEQEEIYEDKKDELWDYAHQIDDICKKDSVVNFAMWKNKSDLNVNDKLTSEDVRQIRNILKALNYTHLEYRDSICRFGIRHQGLALYVFSLGLHGKKIKDNCERIIYNDSVAFEYWCGAIGSCSYPGKEEYLKSKGKTSEY
ncbi:MAG: hypothetical protein MJZ23_10345 [Paludibacteraceae bacterium]|nr:hypothetical protein [Paludibacteraceae bacterium]